MTVLFNLKEFLHIMSILYVIYFIYIIQEIAYIFKHTNSKLNIGNFFTNHPNLIIRNCLKMSSQLIYIILLDTYLSILLYICFSKISGQQLSIILSYLKWIVSSCGDQFDVVQFLFYTFLRQHLK